jgi:hypothetical protein
VVDTSPGDAIPCITSGTTWSSEGGPAYPMHRVASGIEAGSLKNVFVTYI